MLTIDGHSIEFQSAGEGETILFIPGSYSTPAAWRGIQRSLPQRYRSVSTSLCGYGETAETRRIGDLDMAHEVRVIEAVARQINDAPVHLVGHSFGGTVALAVALAGSIDILSITTFEANPLAILKESGHAHLFEDTKRMSQSFEAAFHAGNPDAAGLIIDYWGGAQSFERMPETVKSYCRKTAGSNVLDWRTAFAFEATTADYGRVNLPVLLVRGGLANPVMIAITETLQASLPGSRAVTVEGASHFLISSHAETCAATLAAFLDDVRRGS